MKCIFGILNNRQFWKIEHLATHGDLLTDQLCHHGHLTYCIRPETHKGLNNPLCVSDKT